MPPRHARPGVTGLPPRRRAALPRGVLRSPGAGEDPAAGGAILRSDHPTLQGVQALAITLPLFLLTFANVYFLVAHNVPDSFTDPLTRTDSLYFTVTVFATVGFGDIAPVTQAARVLVTVQMVGNLLLLGIALRVVVLAVQHRRRTVGRDGG
ncbi:MAG: potassium channel family protein [Actinophytocola sp.]|uniref:potassium channel family protein n=1 Tax=Actinophytocola sp. TaxID=1872138 RepID=UPI003D6B5451